MPQEVTADTAVEQPQGAAEEQQVVQPEPQPIGRAPMATEVQFDDSSYSDSGIDEIEATPAQTQAETPVETPVTPAAPAAEAQVPDPVVFPESLLAQAGVTAEEAVKHYGTPDALEKVVRMLDARAAEAGRQYMQATAAGFQYQQQPVQQAHPVIAAQQPAAAQPAQAAEFELPPPEGGGTWDADTVFLAKTLQKQYQAELARRDAEMEQHRQVLTSLMEQQRIAQRASYVNEFDSFVSGLGDAWKPIFGDGPGYQMSPHSPMIANRAHLDQVAAQVSSGRMLQGRPELSRTELLKVALPIAFPDVQQQAVRREVVQQVAQRQGVITARPTQRRSTPPTAELRAAQAAEDWFKARGISTNTDDFDIEDV